MDVACEQHLHDGVGVPFRGCTRCLEVLLQIEGVSPVTYHKVIDEYEYPRNRVALPSSVPPDVEHAQNLADLADDIVECRKRYQYLMSIAKRLGLIPLAGAAMIVGGSLNMDLLSALFALGIAMFVLGSIAVTAFVTINNPLKAFNSERAAMTKYAKAQRRPPVVSE